MGNKIITEEDFWVCSGGAVPAQLQTTQLSTKQISGHKYITVNDKATSSWIDFGCKKLMLIMALLAAVLAVAIVATGGAALAVIVAAGAAAGAAGAAFGAVLGALICGQKAAPARVWNQSKSDLYIQGFQAITGDHTMTCRLFGETIRFAPNIKNWWQAIALGGLNYLTGIVEGALAGALVGLGGGILSGAARLALPTLSSVAGNVAASFGTIGAPVRALFGASNAANAWAVGDANTTSEIAASFANGAVPEAGSAYRIATGQAQAGDAMLLLYLLRLKAPQPKTPPVRNQGQQPAKPGGKGNNGKAYEQGDALPVRTNKSKSAATRADAEYRKLDKANQDKTVASDGGKTLSGWQGKANKRPPGFDNVTPEQVKAYSDQIGHNLKNGGANDQVGRGGFRGKYHASHAEKQLALSRPNEPIGVSRPMCACCQAFFKKHAQYTGRDQIVTDPDGTRIFHPDGTVTGPTK